MNYRLVLLLAEKMALVGKLAAGMAHSIRNPLTSVKMRVFSLNRTLDLSASQKEDVEVISEAANVGNDDIINVHTRISINLLYALQDDIK